MLRVESIRAKDFMKEAILVDTLVPWQREGGHVLYDCSPTTNPLDKSENFSLNQMFLVKVW